MIVKILFAGLIEGMLLQNDIELAKEIDLVTNRLETIINCSEDTLDYNEA